MKRIKVVFKGKVQGVFFRDNTKQKADELNVKGCIRNLENGSVEAVFIGEHHKVDELLEYCSKGPGLAKIEETIVEDYSGEEEFPDFEIKHY